MQNFRFYVLGGVNYQYDLASNATARKADDLVKLSPTILVSRRDWISVLFSRIYFISRIKNQQWDHQCASPGSKSDLFQFDR